DAAAIAIQRLAQAQSPRDDLLDELAALPAEIERRANALRGEGHALPGGIAHREESAHCGAQEPIGEVRAVIRGGLGADLGEESIQGRLELGGAGVRPEPDEARAAHPGNPAEPPAHAAAVSPA